MVCLQLPSLGAESARLVLSLGDSNPSSAALQTEEIYRKPSYAARNQLVFKCFGKNCFILERVSHPRHPKTASGMGDAIKIRESRDPNLV